jgi:hypothetical protein
MILSAKEHEMQHHGQLMLIERVLGITPHLRRRRKLIAAIQPQSAQPDRADSQIDPVIWQYELKQNSTGEGVL